MVSATRCKFACTGAPAADSGTGSVSLQTQYDAELSKEDAAFSKFTPSGSMAFSIDNPNLAGFFANGKQYYITITPVE